MWSWQQQKKISACQSVSLDFGSDVDMVEPILRLLANHAEWNGVCLNVYINADDDEARAIACRLGSSMPINLILEQCPHDLRPVEDIDLLVRARRRTPVS